MSSDTAREWSLRIVDELEQQTIGKTPRPRRTKCLRLIDESIEAIEDIARRCADADMSSYLLDDISWFLIGMKYHFGWPYLTATKRKTRSS